MIKTIAISFFGFCSFGLATLFAKPSHPNVIVIMTDDQGWGDRLAEEGVQFDRFYVQPVCSPTRAEFLTGRYHTRLGVYSTSQGGERFDLGETTIADVFKNAGYRTGTFGKWHSGSQYPYHPHGRGFDEFYGFTSGHWGLYFNPMIEHNGAITRGNEYLPDDYTNRTIEFIEQTAEQRQPFFAFLAFNIPHSPMQVPDRFWEKYESAELAQRGTQADREVPLHTKAALAMCENIDWNVGRLMRSLDELGIDEETIVVYLTDNGPNGHRWNGDMKGKKGSTDEGGVRSPLFMRWPDSLPAGRSVPQISAVIDLLPTLADLADIDYSTSNPLDGVSLKPLLLGESETVDDRPLFAHWRDRTSVRTQRYRLDHQGRLFDMVEDPSQTTDLSEKLPNLAAHLAAQVKHWKMDTMSNEREDRPLLVGHPDYGVTHLPARDAEATGDIQRSNRWPNDSFFQNWRSPVDGIEWEVEVLADGLYTAEIWYACAEENTGCVVELEFGDSSVSVPIHDAHDPPYLGEKYTRSPLYESPVKIFRRIGLGSIELAKGKGSLRLKSPKIPGKESIEFRLLQLARVR